jgi:hypothetical protein
MEVFRNPKKDGALLLFAVIASNFFCEYKDQIMEMLTL